MSVVVVECRASPTRSTVAEFWYGSHTNGAVPYSLSKRTVATEPEEVSSESPTVCRERSVSIFSKSRLHHGIYHSSVGSYNYVITEKYNYR
jgi:hypothetical protein